MISTSHHVNIESRYIPATVNPGWMVGVFAAQSIGGAAIQITLNTLLTLCGFHPFWVSSNNVMLGVASRQAMTVYQEPDMAGDKEAAKNLRSAMEHTTSHSVTGATEIYYDPDIQATVIASDLDLVESYSIIPEDSIDDRAL